MGVSTRVCFDVESIHFENAHSDATAARLIQSSAKESFLPKPFTHLSARNTPDNALALQATLTLLFVTFGGGFRGLVNFVSVASWTFYLLTVSLE